MEGPLLVAFSVKFTVPPTEGKMSSNNFSIAKSADIGNITGVGVLLFVGSLSLLGSGFRPFWEKSLAVPPNGPTPLTEAVLFCTETFDGVTRKETISVSDSPTSRHCPERIRLLDAVPSQAPFAIKSAPSDTLKLVIGENGKPN